MRAIILNSSVCCACALILFIFLRLVTRTWLFGKIATNERAPQVFQEARARFAAVEVPAVVSGGAQSGGPSWSTSRATGTEVGCTLRLRLTCCVQSFVFCRGQRSTMQLLPGVDPHASVKLYTVRAVLSAAVDYTDVTPATEEDR